jgi:Tfp pilus assembly protein PilF
MEEGQLQGAIDQFTKAIALDPAFQPAWARRAEAYALMGREGKAREDRLHLEGLPDPTAD